MAWTLDGTGDYISLANENDFDKTKDNAMSFLIWEKTTTAGFRVMGSKLNGTSPNPGWDFYEKDTAPTDEIVFQLVASSSNKMRKDSTDQTLNNGVWQACIVTYNGGGSNNAAGLKLYAKGARCAETTHDNTLTSTSTTNADSPALGARPAGAAGLWIGSLAHFAMWSTELTANQANALGKGVNPFAIEAINWISYNPLNGLSTTEDDYNGQVHIGTVNGNPVKSTSNPPVQLLSRWLSMC